MKRGIIAVVLISLMLTIFNRCKPMEESQVFITIKEGRFIKNGQPYNFIGANYWYGAILASEVEGGDRDRLYKELNFLKKNGIDNLRILVGAEGPDNQPFRVTPALVKEPGVYSQKLLEGMDFLLCELGKRDMHAILYFTNNWEWSGGMAQYLNWNGYGEYVNPNLEKFTWPDFFNYQKQFYSCEPCVEQVNHYIKTIVTRTNSINGLKYTDDPTIMAWELANEPRPMADDNFEPFTKWIVQTAKLIKELDSNHLLTTGNEGEKGCSESLELFEKIHAFDEIDYMTFHIWIKNWSWYDYTKADSTYPEALKKVQKYFDDHIQIAQKLNKPLVLEEFGIARDNENFLPGSPVTYRDKYYEFVFSKILQSVKSNGNLAGCNFWTFAGFVTPVDGQKYWKLGDPFSGDPPQEEQGLNSVFPTDSSTINIINKYNTLFNRIP